MAVIILSVVFFLFVLIVCGLDHKPGDVYDGPPIPPEPPRQSKGETWSKTHFIDKHLHRDDEKHRRHKQNQTPW